jgi:6-pyruvoyl-tetrahydropterin synthase
LQFAQANAQTKNCKRASTLPTQERISKYFFQRFKKNKTRKRTDQQDKENDSKTQQRQWLTDTMDKNASW